MTILIPITILDKIIEDGEINLETPQEQESTEDQEESVETEVHD